MLNVRVPEEELELRPRITVVGCGGGGCNAVNNMINDGLQGVEFLVCNSDAQSLKMSLAERKIQLGLNVTRGLGAGARPDVGRAAAEEALDEIMGYLEGSNMVFITAGMGGGTGTGGAPVVARAAKEAGILTVGVVTKPFHFEGAHRMRLADAGIEELQQHVDTLLIIPNQNLFRVANEKTTFADAFKMADEVLHAGVRGVTDLMVMPGLINLDFADIRSVMSEMGKAMMGTGEATGERRAVEAAEAAINNPLLEDASMQGARGLLINITGGMDMTLYEVDEACNRIRDEVDPDANIIFGSTFNPEMDGTIRVSVVATGIDSGIRMASNPPQHAGQLQSNPFAQQQQQHGEPTPALNPAANKPSVVPGMFGRGVTLRSGTAATNNPTSQPTQPRTPQQAGTGGNNGHTAMRTPSAPSFYGRGGVAAARVIEDEPMTVGALEIETADDVYGAPQAAERQSVSHDPHRGERDGDSFIPPAPVMTEPKPVSAASAGGVSGAARPQSRQQAEIFAENRPFNVEPAQQDGVEEPVAQTAPAAEAVQQPAPAKRPGLFDRLTGGSSRTQSAPPAEPSQPVLTVDNSDRMPASSYEDDLDIPAFLRRQSN